MSLRILYIVLIICLANWNVLAGTEEGSEQVSEETSNSELDSMADSLFTDKGLAMLDSLISNSPDLIGPWLNEFHVRIRALVSPERQVELVISAADKLFYNRHDSLAQTCIDSAFVIADMIDDSNWKSRTFYSLSWSLVNNNKRYAAMPYLDSALYNLVKEEPDFEARILMDLGRIYYDVGDYATAMQYYDDSRKIYESNGLENTDYADLMHFIGSVFKRQYQDSVAARYYEQMVDIGERLNKPLVKAEGLYLLSDIYGYAGDMKRELLCLDSALTLYQDASNERGITQVLLSIAHAHIYGGDNDTAIKYCLSAIESNQGKSTTIEFNAHRYLGRLYARKGQFKEGQEFFSKAREIAMSSDEKRLINLRNLEYNVAFAYVKEEDWESAFKALEQYIYYQDTLVMKENRNTVLELEERYEKEKNEAEILLLNKDKVIAQSKLDRQKAALLASILVIALVFALAYAIYKGKQKAERAERHKEQFLANMSHEIRTPMHAISGMTKILLRGNPRPKQKRYLDAISESASNLLVILNDILDLSKVEEGKLTVEEIPMNPSHIAKTVVGMLKVKAEEKGINVNTEISNEVPDQVQGDPTRLNQILINLVGNAIKFTDSGSVTVTIALNQERVRYSIKDTGIGIPKNKIESVFASFEQVDASTTRKFGGTGLGLSITKKLVELQGGLIWVESELNKGSVFHFELPLVKVDQEQSSPELSDEELKKIGSEVGPIRILLAEDDDFNIMVATDDLAFYFPKSVVDVAKNGMQAVERFKNSKYDLILMDINMPELSGLDATRQIREIESAENRTHTKVIAMTASLLEKELNKCFEAGMDSYLPKPYSLNQLVDTIRTEVKVVS